MFSERTYALLRELSSGGYSRHYQPHEIETIEALSLDIIGRPVKVCDCKDRYHDAVLEMLRLVQKNISMKSHYLLKAGVVIQFRDGAVYTNANLTDEVAERFLRERPNAEGLFAYLPPKKATVKKVATTPKKSTIKTA